jgi:hypothetical protein
VIEPASAGRARRIDAAKGLVRASPLEVPASYVWGAATLHWPRWLGHAIELHRTRAPDTFALKVRYKMARDRRPLLTTLADKLAARDYVAERAGAGLLLDVPAIAERAADLPWDRLPRECAIKVNHGSGGVIVVSDFADPAERLPTGRWLPSWTRHLVRPSAFDPAAAAALVDHWLALPYRQGPVGRWEPAYAGIPRRVFVEEYAGSAISLPADLKVVCIHGEPELISVITRTSRFVLDVTRRFLPEEHEAARDAAGIDQGTWDEVLAASRAVSAETDLVRVDWLVTGQGIRFGELTNYMSGGVPTFHGHAQLSSRQLAERLSALWTVPETYQ